MANFSEIIAKMIRHIMISQGTCFGVVPLANKKPSGPIGKAGVGGCLSEKVNMASFFFLFFS